MRQTTSLLVLILSILSARVVGASECEDYLAKLDALMGREPTEEQFYPRRGGMFAGSVQRWETPLGVAPISEGRAQPIWTTSPPVFPSQVTRSSGNILDARMSMANRRDEPPSMSTTSRHPRALAPFGPTPCF